jgi:hypothetical protein
MLQEGTGDGMTVTTQPFSCPHLAWRHALESVSQRGVTGHLLITFEARCDAPEHQALESDFDAACSQFKAPSLRTVVNTVFPVGLYSDYPNAEELYARYARMYPSIKKLPQNRRGTYFGRMIGHGAEADLTQGANQLKQVIRELGNDKGLHHISEVTLVDPRKDKRPWGFPCLVHVSLHRDGLAVNLTAVYRNHDFVRRGLGNYLSLGQLLIFVANQASREVGQVTVLSVACYADPGKHRDMLWKLAAELHE